jgi:hypothetical protein
LITLPKKLEERLKKESKKFGLSEEELILEALSKSSMSLLTQKRGFFSSF